MDEDIGKVFCLVGAPSKEAAEVVHRKDHGQVAEDITEVKEAPSGSVSLPLG